MGTGDSTMVDIGDDLSAGPRDNSRNSAQQARGSANLEVDRRPSDSLDLIDVLFAAVLTVGLAPEVLQVSNVQGILSELWVTDALTGAPRIPSDPEINHCIAFAIGTSTLLLSWFGIHGSLRKNPITYGSTCGMLRFMLDVSLILAYGVLLLFFRHAHSALFILMVIYCLFLVWDILKTFEYKGEFWTPFCKTEPFTGCPGTARGRFARTPLTRAGHIVCEAIHRFRRQLASLIFAVCFIALWCIYQHELTRPILLAALAFTFVYRVCKERFLCGVVSALAVWLCFFGWIQFGPY